MALDGAAAMRVAGRELELGPREEHDEPALHDAALCTTTVVAVVEVDEWQARWQCTRCGFYAIGDECPRGARDQRTLLERWDRDCIANSGAQAASVQIDWVLRKESHA